MYVCFVVCFVSRGERGDAGVLYVPALYVVQRAVANEEMRVSFMSSVLKNSCVAGLLPRVAREAARV